MSNLFEDSSEVEKLVTSVSVVSIAKVQFSCRPGIQKQQVTNSVKFLDYIGGQFGQSIKASLEAGEVIVIEIDKRILPRFDTKAKMNKYITALKFWQ